VQGGKHTLSWRGQPVTLPKNKVKLLLNLLALGVVALPRGGTVNVEIRGEGPQVAFRVLAQGEPARLSDQVIGLLAGANGMVLDAHSIQPYYAGRVAAAAGMTVTVETRDREVELRAA
jgi:histidine phosphotransferase ChpT